jgi:RHS repeat-associated protein
LIINSENIASKQAPVWEWQYNLTDHLGNVRVVLTGSNPNSATIIQENHYYPFGMLMADIGSTYPDYNPENVTQPYLYNGKEYHPELELNWYDYGARFYDPSLGRFTTHDPMTEEFMFQSPYLYASNNPVRFIDYRGMYTDGYKIDEENGKIERIDNTGGDNYDVLYTKSDYERAKATGETNSYGNPEPTKQQRVSVKDNNSVLRQLSTDRTDYIGRYAIDESLEDIGNVFLFASMNSNVEFGFSSFKRDNKSNIYVVNTKHKVSGVDKPYFLGFSEFDLTYHLHSHPGMKSYDGKWYDGTKGGSGGDMPKLQDYYRKWIGNGKNPHDFPEHGVVHKSSKTIYYYTPWVESIKGHTFK